MEGARAVSERVLAAEPSDDVRLFVVWVNRGTGDNRAAVDTTLLDDERVAQYWDAGGITGKTFAERRLGGLDEEAFLYDVYWVFGPSASWTDLPEPVTAAGVTVVDSTDRLLAEIRAQL